MQHSLLLYSLDSPVISRFVQGLYKVHSAKAGRLNHTAQATPEATGDRVVQLKERKRDHRNQHNQDTQATAQGARPHSFQVKEGLPSSQMFSACYAQQVGSLAV